MNIQMNYSLFIIVKSPTIVEITYLHLINRLSPLTETPQQDRARYCWHKQTLIQHNKFRKGNRLRHTKRNIVRGLGRFVERTK